MNPSPNTNASGSNVVDLARYARARAQNSLPGLPQPPEEVPVFTPDVTFTIRPEPGSYNIEVRFDDAASQIFEGVAITADGWVLPVNELNSPNVSDIIGFRA